MNVLIHSKDIKLSEKTRESIKCKILFSLSKFQSHIENVDLHIKDINGPKGGIDKLCTITITALRGKPFVVSSTSDNLFSVIGHCVRRARLAFSRKLKLKKVNPKKAIFLKALEFNQSE
jgi:putative sigma-54 modulation protein